MKSLNYLNSKAYKVGTCHQIWTSCTADPLEVHKAKVHAKLTVQRYPLQDTHLHNSKDNTCPICKKEPDTLQHFILLCRTLAGQRHYHLDLIKKNLVKEDVSTDTHTLLIAILDVSALELNQDTTTTITQENC
jgi:hypothetical protein